MERQNKSLHKRMQITQVGEEDWKVAVLAILVVNRNTILIQVQGCAHQRWYSEGHCAETARSEEDCQTR